MLVLTRRGGSPVFEGWDAIDPVWSFRDLGELRIPVDGDHVLAKLHDMQSPFLGPIDATDPLLVGLGRAPRAAILVPVFVASRLAGVLYGDCGDASIPPSSLAELHMVVPRFGNALRNLIVRQKQLSASREPAVLERTHAVLPAATVEGAIPVIELDDDDFDEVAELESDGVGSAIDRLVLASAGSFDIPPIPADDVAVEVADVIPADDRPPPSVTGAPTPSALGSAVPIAADAAEADGPLPADLADFDDDTNDNEDDISTDEGTALAELRRRRAAEQIRDDVARVSAIASEAPRTTPPPLPRARLLDDDASRVAKHAVTPIEDEGGRADVRPTTATSTDDDRAPPSDDAGHAEDAGVDDEPAHAQRADDQRTDDQRADDQRADDALVATAAEHAPLPSEPGRDDAAAPTHEDAPDTAPTSSPEVDDGARDQVLSREPVLAEFHDLADDTLQPVASPGRDAREAHLLATHRAWLAHVDEEADALLAGLHAPGESGRAHIVRLASLGDRAMPSLARYFPGALTVHPFGALQQRPEPRDLSDALACLLRIGVERAAPILVAEVTHEDRLHRYVAVVALGELVVPAALPRLVERVFDPEFRIALLALEVLPRYADCKGYDRVLTQLRDLIRRGDDFQRRRAIVAAAELHDREAIPALADTLGTRPREISDEAHRALIDITKRDLGTSTRRWRAWFDDSARQRRMEWLIQGLVQKETEIRKSAQTELNTLTGRYFGYRYDAPRGEREVAALAWQRWWAEEADQSAWP